MRRALRLLSKRLPGGRRVMRRLDRVRHLRLIRRSGIFDVSWYCHQTPDAPTDPEAALQHYLNRGRHLAHTPCPLFDPTWFDPKGWRAKGVDPLVHYLLHGPGRNGPHPLFDERQWLEQHPQARRHPGRGLGHFLATAADGEVIPNRLDGVTITRRELVTLVRRAIDRWAEDAERGRRRIQRSWNRAAEHAFRERWRRVPLPPAGDGPLVSVITPVRNRATQVLTAIASVQTQSMSNWELIVVDDGSTDRTADAVELVAAQDRRVRLLRLPHGGVSAARNAGIAAARGRYVAFLDSDNLWVPDFLQLMTAAMHGTGALAAYSALEISDGQQVSYLAFEGDLGHLEHGNHVDLNVLVTHRTLLLQIGGFDPSLRRMVDYDLVVRLARVTDLHLFPFVGTVYDSRDEVGPRISTSESLRWDEAVKNRLFVDWDAVRQGLGSRVPGRVSVLMPTSAPPALTLRAVTHLQRHAGDADLEIVVLDNGGPRTDWVQLSAALGRRTGVRLTRFSRDVGPVFGADRALPESTGEIVVLVRPEVVVDGPWLQPLVEALADPDVGAAQPLVVDSAGLLCTAGTYPVAADGGDDPVYLPGLRGLPVEDAAALVGRDIPAAGGPMVALRAADLAAGDGLDPLLGPDAAVADLVWRTSTAPRHGRLVDAPPVRFLPAPSPRLPDRGAGPAVAAFPEDPHEHRVLGSRPEPQYRPRPGTYPCPWLAVGLTVTVTTPPGATTPTGTIAPPGATTPGATPPGTTTPPGATTPTITTTTPPGATTPTITTTTPPGATTPTGTTTTPPGTTPTGTTTSPGLTVTYHRAAEEPLPAGGTPRLRWAIKTAAPAGPTGNAWGDVHFAAALARALGGLGQHVVVDRREAVARPTAGLDDVVLTLRGLDVVEPVPGAVNLIWVISHPDQVSDQELAGFDHAFAASLSWAAEVTARGIAGVEPLLQATDPALFHPDRAEPGTGPAVVFVGNSRDVLRPMVRDALAARLPLTLYGSRWHTFVDPGLVAAEHVPNEELGVLYRSAGVVLNDHWEDMARDGFLSNRLFDAVAAGAQVISDRAAGLDEVFGPEVAAVDSADDLARLLDADGRPRAGTGLADPQTLLAASQRVRDEHSFNVRAMRLVEVALAAQEARAARQSADQRSMNGPPATEDLNPAETCACAAHGSALVSPAGATTESSLR
jgi:hypothetical protein